MKTFGFGEFKTQLPLSRTTDGWMIKRVVFDVASDVLTVNLLECLLETHPDAPLQAQLKIEGPVSFRTTDEANLSVYWNEFNDGGVDRRAAIYSIQSSEYLDATRTGFATGDPASLSHVLIPGIDACLEVICAPWTAISVGEIKELKR